VTAALLGRDTPEVVVFALVALLVLFRHAPNIGRLARGREGPLGPAGGDGRGLG
jgi:glycerol-3-phosphate acyltransferase PlsY